MTPEIQLKIDEILPEIEKMKKHIKVYDDISNPTDY